MPDLDSKEMLKWRKSKILIAGSVILAVLFLGFMRSVHSFRRPVSDNGRFIKYCKTVLEKEKIRKGRTHATTAILKKTITQKGTFDGTGNVVDFTTEKKTFIYLIQGESCLQDFHMTKDALGEGKHLDVLFLSYKSKCNKAHPKHIKYITSKRKTTWTEGRNFLYR